MPPTAGWIRRRNGLNLPRGCMILLSSRDRNEGYGLLPRSAGLLPLQGEEAKFLDFFARLLREPSGAKF